MSTKTVSQQVVIDALQHELERLRNRLVDMEAVAHAAEQTLQDLPYTPQRSSEADDAPVTGEAEPYSDDRLGMGRLQTLVSATATASRTVLQEADELIGRLHKLAARARGHRAGGSGNGGSSRAEQPLAPMWRSTDQALRVVPPMQESA